MKTILAFGDSLTWGHRPEDGARHPREDRWPTVLGQALGDVEMISEGMCARNTSFDDYAGHSDRNGTRALPVLLSSHMPLDLVLIMLGTNDLKPAICGVAEGAEKGMQRLVRIIQTFPWDKPDCGLPQIVIVAPPPQVEGGAHSPQRIRESHRIAGLYKALAASMGVHFFDAASVCTASFVDGTHLDAENTRALGRGLAPLCRELLGL